ncbi:MAG: hypothetical protein WC975_09390 [Phycisphaerae bacterium]
MRIIYAGENLVSDDLINVDLRMVCRYLVRKIWIAVLLSLIAGSATWYYLKQNPTYQSKSLLLIQPVENSQTYIFYNATDLLTLANSLQVIEKTKAEFLKTVLENQTQSFPQFRGELVGQKKLLLVSQGRNPAVLDDYLVIWIKELKRAYEENLKLRLMEHKKRQANLLGELTRRYQMLEDNYHKLIIMDHPAKVSQTERIRLDLAEIKKNTELASIRMAQITLMADSVHKTLKILMAPGELREPVYEPGRIGIAVGIMSLGLLVTLLLLFAVYTQLRATRITSFV